MRAFARVLVTAAVVGTAAALSVGAGVAERQSAQDAGDTGLVEDYTYPGADAILANRGIKLISGDGHLVMVDCVNVTGLIEVHAFNAGDHSADPGHYCFQVLGMSGDLKLELTDAYQVKGDNKTVKGHHLGQRPEQHRARRQGHLDRHRGRHRRLRPRDPAGAQGLRVARIRLDACPPRAVRARRPRPRPSRTSAPGCARPAGRTRPRTPGGRSGPTSTTSASWSRTGRTGSTGPRRRRSSNALPQFRAALGGHRHPLRARPGRAPAGPVLPLVLSHGWPDSFWRYSKVIPLLTDPGAHGGDPADAFDVVVPDMPGYGYSDRPPARRWTRSPSPGCGRS